MNKTTAEVAACTYVRMQESATRVAKTEQDAKATDKIESRRLCKMIEDPQWQATHGIPVLQAALRSRGKRDHIILLFDDIALKADGFVRLFKLVDRGCTVGGPQRTKLIPATLPRTHSAEAVRARFETALAQVAQADDLAIVEDRTAYFGNYMLLPGLVLTVLPPIGTIMGIEILVSLRQVRNGALKQQGWLTP